MNQRLHKPNDIFKEIALPDGEGVVLIADWLEISLDDLLEKLGGRVHNKLFETTANLLESAKLLWQPKAVYRWLNITHTDNGKVLLSCQHTRQTALLDLGVSSHFLKEARKVFLGVYTVGRRLESVAQKVTEEGKLLDGYIYDCISLAVLDRLNLKLRRIAEDFSREKNQGVSPLLSPGSVHGWDLEEQMLLCSMLPLSMIDVEIRKSGVLVPFKSVSFIIGTGAGYKSTTVGNICAVCSKRDICEMRPGISMHEERQKRSA